MKKLAALLVLVAALVAVDLGARAQAEARIAGAVAGATRGAVGAEADVAGFPFLPSLLTSGTVSSVQIRVDRIRGRSLELTDLVVDLEGVRLDRDRLLAGKAELRSIDRGRVGVRLDAGSLASVLGGVVTVSGGEVRVEVAGRSLSAAVAVTEGPALEFDLGLGAPVRVPLPVGSVMPCSPTVLFMDSFLQLSCSFTDVPPALLAAVNGG